MLHKVSRNKDTHFMLGDRPSEGSSKSSSSGANECAFHDQHLLLIATQRLAADMKRWQPVFPGYCFLKGCGNPQQQKFFSESGNELDAHG